MIVICLLVFITLSIFIIGACLDCGNTNDFEIKYSKYNVKVINPDKLCWNCSYFYDGTIDSYPYVSMDDRPHPHCCANKNRCLENKSKCYVRDNL